MIRCVRKIQLIVARNRFQVRRAIRMLLIVENRFFASNLASSKAI